MIKRPFLKLYLLLSLCFFSVLGQAAPPTPKPPQIEAKSHILIDFNSGQTLASENPDMRVEPASITKLMTAYIVFKELEDGNFTLSDEVLISEKAWRMGGSKMFVEVGNRVPVEDLIRGMIIQSGNDATVALAEFIAGSEETFASYMNQVAASLGMKNSNFTNSTGWPGPEHYTTARDIATLAQALIRDFPTHYGYYSEQEFIYNGIKQHNRNALLRRDESVDGLKTGYTESAGYCLVTSGEREGMRLVSVVIGTNSIGARTRYSQALLNYGFRFFETHKLFTKGNAMDEIQVWKGATDSLAVGPGRDFYVTAPRGKKDDLKIQADLHGEVFAPVEAGATLGELSVALDGEVMKKTPVVALQSVALGSWWQRLLDEAKLFIVNW
ncbi:MAG: D-alanyl-D-alanine carboxypeptidase family protein [Salinisphaeraceae bacterium]|nr:D-alanyl-D-alanine carboxypeptidase family protein [Salinisphaeraceae bacterium]